MKVPPSDNRGAQAARAVLMAQPAARLQDAPRAEELANAQRLQEVQLRQEQEDLARDDADRERRDAPRTFSGP